jgi:hypothetical protein
MVPVVDGTRIKAGVGKTKSGRAGLEVNIQMGTVRQVGEWLGGAYRSALLSGSMSGHYLAMYMQQNRGTLIHELAHHFDPGRDHGVASGEFADRGDYAGYANTASEVNAFYQEAAAHYEELLHTGAKHNQLPRMWKVMIGDDVKKFVAQFTKYMDKNFGNWEVLTPDNQRRVIKRATGLHAELKALKDKLAGPVTESTEVSAVEGLPLAGAVVDGRNVINANHVPNIGSIQSSLSNYTVLKGIRVVLMAEFTLTGRTYSASGNRRIKELAGQIQASQEITPLIVVYDNDGPYILEGATRADALYILGAKAFPALVVIDHDGAVAEDEPRIYEGKKR